MLYVTKHPFYTLWSSQTVFRISNLIEFCLQFIFVALLFRDKWLYEDYWKSHQAHEIKRKDLDGSWQIIRHLWVEWFLLAFFRFDAFGVNHLFTQKCEDKSADSKATNNDARDHSFVPWNILPGNIHADHICETIDPPERNHKNIFKDLEVFDSTRNIHPS